MGRDERRVKALKGKRPVSIERICVRLGVNMMIGQVETQ